jgi:hypothetical protein
MGGYGRNYVRGDSPMYRAVWVRRWVNRDTGCVHEETSYAGPYSTLGPAKRMRGPGGWVEVCYPQWQKLEE